MCSLFGFDHECCQEFQHVDLVGILNLIGLQKLTHKRDKITTNDNKKSVLNQWVFQGTTPHASRIADVALQFSQVQVPRGNLSELKHKKVGVVQ